MDGENVQAQQFEGESKTDESAPSTSINAQCQRNGRQFLKYFHWEEENTFRNYNLLIA